MSFPRDSKPFPGTQSDTYSYDRGMKPTDQPPCDRPDQHQFANGPIEGAYIETYRDKYGNEYTVDQPMHRDATQGMSVQAGGEQFAHTRDSLRPDDFSQFNVIEYGSGQAFQMPEKVVVDVSRADRGRES